MSGMEILGTDALIADLRNRFGSASVKLENQGLRRAGDIIAAEEKSIVAFSKLQYSAHIRDDIRVTRVMRKDGMKYVLVRQSKQTGWRVHLLEFGTTKMGAQPYKEPAFHAKKQAALNAMAETYREGLING